MVARLLRAVIVEDTKSVYRLRKKRDPSTVYTQREMHVKRVLQES